MIKTNVVKLSDVREKRDARRSQENYKRYLGTLANSQLEGEINYLLDAFSNDNYGNDFSNKVHMIQTELVLRADGDWKVKIAELSRETPILL